MCMTAWQPDRRQGKVSWATDGTFAEQVAAQSAVD
jgi:hypothetical protein